MKLAIGWYRRLDPWTRAELHKMAGMIFGVGVCFWLLWVLP